MSGNVDFTKVQISPMVLHPKMFRNSLSLKSLFFIKWMRSAKDIAPHAAGIGIESESQSTDDVA